MKQAQFLALLGLTVSSAFCVPVAQASPGGFLFPGGARQDSVIHAPGSSLDGKTVTQWGATIDANAAAALAAQTAAKAAIPLTQKGAPFGVAPLNAGGNSTAPATTVISLSGSDTAASPADTDVTIYTLTPTGSTTVALVAGSGAGHQKTVELLVAQPGTGGFAVTISGPISWPNGAAPTISAAPGDKTLIRLLTLDGGQTYIGGI